MVQKDLRKHVWLPCTFLCIGLAVYIYYGITWNAWMKNLPNMIIYIIIIVTLAWALRKQNQLRERRNSK